MLNLWRKTIELLRKYPILWVPYLCADVATSCLTWLRRLASKAIFHWVATKHLHSVLGGDVVTTNFDYDTMKKALRLSAPLEWVTQYVNACLYVAALILVAVLVAMVLRGEKPDLAAAAPTLRTYSRRILLFALIFCALTLVLTALAILPSNYLLSVKLQQSRVFLALLIGEELLTTICSAWIMTPIAIALIRPRDAVAVSVERRSLGRRFAVLVGATVIGLSQLSGLLMTRLGPISNLGQAVLRPLDSLVVNAPCILLFIALALIAAEDPLEIQSVPLPKTRKLLQDLMPLHFSQGDRDR